jgi:hypothetical protein
MSKSQKGTLARLMRVIVKGYHTDPGNSDLDNEQPIFVSMTLGDYRTAMRMAHELEEK